jgi:hypothetical protein
MMFFEVIAYALQIGGAGWGPADMNFHTFQNTGKLAVRESRGTVALGNAAEGAARSGFWPILNHSQHLALPNNSCAGHSSACRFLAQSPDVKFVDTGCDLATVGRSGKVRVITLRKMYRPVRKLNTYDDVQFAHIPPALD